MILLLFGNEAHLNYYLRIKIMNCLQVIMFFLVFTVTSFGQTLVFKKGHEKIIISKKQEVNFKLKDSSNIMGHLKTVNANDIVVATIVSSLALSDFFNFSFYKSRTCFFRIRVFHLL